jgi:hypothetical protein
MAKMLKTNDGTFVLASEIVCIRDAKGSDRSEIITRNGEKYIVSGLATRVAAWFQDYESAIPAQPGFWALVPDDLNKHDTVHFRKVPVVGWQKFKHLKSYWDNEFLEPFWAKPVFAGYYNFDEADWWEWGLLHPDGRVFDQLFNVFPNISKFLEAKSKRLKKRCVLAR